MQAVTLRSGQKMPLMGLGTWKIDKKVAANVVYEAIKSGYRLIDAACDYGNEEEVGAGIKRAIDEGVVKREDLFVTSKLWNTYHRKEHVKPACEKSLRDLGLDYLDLYLIHFPISQRFVPFEKRYPPEWFYDPQAPNPKIEEDLVPYQETWQAMESLVHDGLVKNIGSCNIGAVMIRDVLSYCDVPPAVLQVEIHPQNAQSKLIRFCKEREIAVTAFSSFGGTSYVELGASESGILLNKPEVQSMADKHGKSPAQVLLRWAVQQGIAVIPKSSKKERLEENMAIFDFHLDDEEMQTLNAMDRGIRYNSPDDFCEAGFNTFYPIYS